MEDIRFDGKTYEVETYESHKTEPTLDNAVSLKIEVEDGEQRAGIWEMMKVDGEKHFLSLERDDDIPSISDPDHSFSVVGSDFIALQHFLANFEDYRDFDSDDHVITTNDPDLSTIFRDLVDRIDGVDSEDSRELLKVMIESISEFSDEVDDIELSEGIAEEDTIRAHSMLKLASVRRACDRLEEIIENEESEDDCQDMLKKHPWIFGNEYTAKLDRELLYEGQVDFALKSVDGFLDFIELKRPDMNPVNFDGSHENYYPQSDLTKAISQLSHYIREAEREESRITDSHEVRPLKPRGIIVIGSELSDEEKEGLKIIESHLSRIDLITYSDLYNRAERIKDLYEREGELRVIGASD